MILLFSVIASIIFSGYFVTRSKEEKKIKAFLIGTLATYIISIIVLGLTGIWEHHLQLIYFSQALMLVCIAISLNSKKALADTLFGIAIVVLAILFSGTGNLRHYVVSPQQFMAQISSLTQESPEIQAFRSVYANGAGFARLGQNSNVIPHGAPNDKLLCPEFQQYYFYSPKRLQHILDCAKTAPILVVDGSFSLYGRPPKWWPRESQKQIMMENWNDFVTAGERMIKMRYSCKRLGNIRICGSVAR